MVHYCIMNVFLNQDLGFNQAQVFLLLLMKLYLAMHLNMEIQAIHMNGYIEMMFSCRVY